MYLLGRASGATTIAVYGSRHLPEVYDGLVYTGKSTQVYVSAPLWLDYGICFVLPVEIPVGGLIYVICKKTNCISENLYILWSLVSLCMTSTCLHLISFLFSS